MYYMKDKCSTDYFIEFKFPLYLGPPIARTSEVERYGRVGQTIHLRCPVLGNPSPIVEWSKVTSQCIF